MTLLFTSVSRIIRKINTDPDVRIIQNFSNWKMAAVKLNHKKPRLELSISQIRSNESTRITKIKEKTYIPPKVFQITPSPECLRMNAKIDKIQTKNREKLDELNTQIEEIEKAQEMIERVSQKPEIQKKLISIEKRWGNFVDQPERYNIDTTWISIGMGLFAFSMPVFILSESMSFIINTLYSVKNAFFDKLGDLSSSAVALSAVIFFTGLLIYRIKKEKKLLISYLKKD